MGAWSTNNPGLPKTTDLVLSDVGVIAQRIDNCERGLSGVDTIAANISGGSIEGTPIGAITPDSGSFTDLTLQSLTVDNINIDTNTIKATNPGGYINLDGIVSGSAGGRLQVSEIFGTWVTSQVATLNTPIQATTDEIIVATFSGNGGATANVLCDSANPPTKQIANTLCGFTGIGSGAVITFPVKKNHYWKVTESGNSVTSITYSKLPIGVV